ncbi:hypothetical protein IGI04_021284 [Brassica rapa subsp. trilocularis]|uniref:PRA1 family protein n=1 Tax=Brassica rapa subsp. trilocularis TaxID=1813537 RepID=A0ABQ7LXN7_BRACM|nr:hypothetical protein IGI04_021284 [Brassica rapa subsp. trilocularis]
MTNYGSIPTSSHPSPPIDLEYISRAKYRIKSGLATRRPWKTMFDLQSMNLPHGFFDAISRIKTNLVYFRANYAVVVLLVLFLSLVYHPTSLLVLAVLVVFWIFLYFLRDEPLVVFGHQIDDRTVMICLSVLTIVMLLFTHATANVLGAVATAVVLVLVHAAVRRSDNLYLDEEAAAASEASGLTKLDLTGTSILNADSSLLGSHGKPHRLSNERRGPSPSSEPRLHEGSSWLRETSISTRVDRRGEEQREKKLSSKIHSLTQRLSKTNVHVSSIPSPIKSSLPSSATPRINRSFRVPVELSSCISLFPLHSAVASSRLVSSLSAESMSWGLVPQGISMPL